LQNLIGCKTEISRLLPTINHHWNRLAQSVNIIQEKAEPALGQGPEAMGLTETAGLP
jgi:hypothetical protein